MRRVVLKYWVPWGMLVCLCAFNFWFFQWALGLGYLKWFLSAGPFVSLAMAALGAAWGRLDRNIGLISARPCDYVGACLQVAGLPILVFGGHLRKANQPQGLSLGDILLGLPLVAIFVVAIIAWLLLIAPLQYFVFLVCAAPSRIAI